MHYNSIYPSSSVSISVSTLPARSLSSACLYSDNSRNSELNPCWWEFFSSYLTAYNSFNLPLKSATFFQKKCARIFFCHKICLNLPKFCVQCFIKKNKWLILHSIQKFWFVKIDLLSKTTMLDVLLLLILNLGILNNEKNRKTMYTYI